MFLDIKGGFDNVRSSALAARLRSHKTPSYIVNWILSFISNMSCRLLFKEGLQQFVDVNIGVPQGSPISPLLFVIYVAPLHSVKIPKGLTLSYVDDLALTKASPSYYSNIRRLQAAWSNLQEVAVSLFISFSIPTTEFIHWRTSHDHNPIYHGPIVLNDILFFPLPQVKWLGMWFSSNLNVHHHFQQRYSKGCRTFGWLQTHSRPGSGLSAVNALRLAQAVILPTILYGSEVLQPKAAALNLLNSLWTRVLRWITNFFKSTDINILYPEAALMPLEIYCYKNRLSFARRVSLLSPLRNPVTARFAHDFPLPDKTRTKLSFQHLLPGNPNLPCKWNQDLKPGRTYLPINQLSTALKNLFLLTNPDSNFGTPFIVTKKQILDSMMTRWATLYPPPSYYSQPYSTKLHLFMSFDKFIGGRFHQFRAQKSYLSAHQSWHYRSLSTHCPRCHDTPEDLHHALIECKLRDLQRHKFIPYLEEVDDIWTSFPKLLKVIQYMHSTKTSFPPSWSGWFPLSPGASSE